MERFDNISSYNLETMDKEEFIIEWIKTHKDEYTDDVYDELIGIASNVVEIMNDNYSEKFYNRAFNDAESLIINQKMLLRDALKWRNQRDAVYAEIIIKYYNKKTDTLEIKNNKINYNINPINNNIEINHVNPLTDFSKATDDLYDRIVKWNKEEDYLISFFEEFILKADNMSIKEKTYKYN